MEYTTEEQCILEEFYEMCEETTETPEMILESYYDAMQSMELEGWL